MITCRSVDDQGAIAASSFNLPHTEAEAMQPSPGLGRAQTNIQPCTTNFFTHGRASSSFPSPSQGI